MGAMIMETQETSPLTDNAVAPFAVEGAPVRGRLARLGSAIDEILTRHDYPDAVANLLGEACTLAALVGSNLKFEGRLIVQAQGDGPVAYVVADYDSNGGLRGYCRYDADRVAEVSTGFARPGAKTLLGKDRHREGVFLLPEGEGQDEGDRSCFHQPVVLIARSVQRLYLLITSRNRIIQSPP